MGNQSSTKEQGPTFGGIIIQTDKPYYFAGDIVTGNIHIDVTHPNYPGNTLVLKIKGYEQCYWSADVLGHAEGTGKHKRVYRRLVKYEDKVQIYSNKVSIYTFGEMSVQQGQYTFPFQFQLRSNIPGSVQLLEHKFYGKIIYELSAKIQTTEKTVTILKAKQCLNIREMYRGQIQSVQKEEKPQVQGCFDIDRGVTYFKAFVEKDICIIGQSCIVQVVIDNSQCSVAVKNINVELMNVMDLKLRYGAEKGKQFSISKISSQTAVEANQGGQSTFKLELPIIDQNNAILCGIANGTIVKNSYKIRVSLNMNTWCTCDRVDPELYLPITLVAGIPTQPKIVKPANWNPDVMKTLTIKFDQTNEKKQIQQQTLNQNIIKQNQDMDWFDLPSKQQQQFSEGVDYQLHAYHKQDINPFS